MAKYGVITDTHFGARNDNVTIQQMQKEFYLNEFFPDLVKRGITTVFHGGDMFDKRKGIGFQSLDNFRECIVEPSKKHGIKWYIIPGNHDVFFKNTNELNAPNLLLQNEDIFKIIHEPEMVEGNIAMIPWINRENYASTMKWVDDNISMSTIVIGHFEFAGFEMYRGSVNDHGMDHKLFKKAKRVYSGHFHEPSTQGNTSYLGAPYEMNWSDADCDRGYHILDSVTGDTEYVKCQVKMFYKMYYDDEFTNYDEQDVSMFKDKCVKLIVSNKTKPDMFERYIHNVHEAGTLEFKIVEDFSHLLGENVADTSELVEAKDTLSVMQSYIDSVEDTTLDKTQVKKTIQEIYTESLERI